MGGGASPFSAPRRRPDGSHAMGKSDLMKRLFNGVLWLIGLCVVLFVFFFVPVGRWTLFQHTLRIAATEPAQELREDLERTGSELTERAMEEGGRALEELREGRPRHDEATPEAP